MALAWELAKVHDGASAVAGFDFASVAEVDDSTGENAS
jgi:hypothetical protein